MRTALIALLVLSAAATAGTPRNTVQDNDATEVPRHHGTSTAPVTPAPATSAPAAPVTSAPKGLPAVLGGVIDRVHRSGGNAGKPTIPTTEVNGGHRDHRDGDHDRHHRGGGVVVVPFPYGNWYPPYPWPYPPGQWYPDYPTSDDSDSDVPPPGEMQQASRPFWYYCDQPDGYYPYVKTCAHEWSTIPISPPPPGAAAPLSYADWQWCDEKKAFFPYVSSCPNGFEPVPVTTPKSVVTLPEAANWFFCDDPKGYVPYVMQCKNDWRPVPSVPPAAVPITVKQARAH